jgi:phosphatidylserine/phosphatidylglycerophosphate/cardiolipin synthase-like enzyme
MAQGNVVAIANNDYVHVAWDFGEPLPNCGGFAVYRLTKGGDAQGEPLPVFDRDADGNRVSVNCERMPIRKYNWRDLLETRGGRYKYRVVPMLKPQQPMPGVATAITSDWVDVSPKQGANVEVYFNRGILGTQSVADKVWNPSEQKPDFAEITAQIRDVNSDLRKSLSGQLFTALTRLLDRAKKDGGSCWASLYELTDQALIDALCACEELHLVLSNNNGSPDDGADGDDPESNQYDGKNQAAAKQIAAAIADRPKSELIRRYMPSGHIGHNKFMVYVDKQGVPKALLTGSTNWTATGLCTQSNNAILIESEVLAKQYLVYWSELKADAEAAGIPEEPKPVKLQAKALRDACAQEHAELALNPGSTLRAWYSPNTPKQQGKTVGPTPIDMAQVYEALRAAKHSVLFLAFMPGKAGATGSAHFLQELAKIAAAKPGLFVRGAVSDPDLAREFDMKTLEVSDTENAMVSSPQGIFKNFEAWRKEIYKYGHAIIHDKTIVIDPFSKDCVVITGSHNLGYRASSNNDENMLIMRGDQGVATAYAAHVMDIFEHYRSRWIAANHKETDYDPRTDPAWQQKYFDNWRPAYAERLFWVSEGKPLPALAPNPKLKRAAAGLEAAAAAKKEAAAARRAAKQAAAAPARKAGGKKPAKKKAAKGAKTAAKKAPTKTKSKKKAPKKEPARNKPVQKKAAKKKNRKTPPRSKTTKKTAKKAAARKKPAKGAKKTAKKR